MPTRTRPVLLTACLALVLVGMVVFALTQGFIAISPGDVLSVLRDGLRGMTPPDSLFAGVVLEVRLPRIMTALFVGFGLSVAGTVFQGLLLNPLADPFTLGVSSGAAFGAALTLLLGLQFFGPATLCLMAFAGASFTLLAVIALSGREGELSPANLILAGVIVSSILSAGLSFIKYMADERVASIVFWLMGSFVGRTGGEAWLTGGSVLACSLVCCYYARDLNIMSLGGRSARSLGVNTNRVRLILLLTASLMSAVCVAVSGVIGFVGLVVQHLLRLALGPDNRWLIPAAGLGGGVLLLGADTVSRTALPHEVPIGVLTALIGGPVFCLLFAKTRSRRRYD